MILSDRDIKKAINQGKITFTPTVNLKNQLGSCSVDLRLGHTFRVFKHSRYPYIDPRDKRLTNDMMDEQMIADGETFVLQPGEFVLASTIESFTLPNDLLARLEGRSSLGRLGIVVHSTASIFEPGWEGVVVMELGNLGRMPVALIPGMRICALTFEQLTTPAQVPYSQKQGAKYIRQTAPVPSKISEEKYSVR